MIQNWNDYLEMKPDVLGGKIHIKGTRIGVDLILEKLANGEGIEQILESYPHLNKHKILACISYAFYAVKNESIYELA